MDALRASLERLLNTHIRASDALQDSELVVYGAGGCGRAVAANATARGMKVRAFLDGRADQIRQCDGVPCVEPKSGEATELARSGVPVVVGVFNYTTDVRPIRRLLTELGFERLISYPEFHEQFCDAPDFWLTKRSYYRERSAEILEGFDLFADANSRQVYYDTLQFRLSFNPDILSAPDDHRQYLPADLPPPASPMRLIDGGAFVGDTLELFLEHGVTFDAVAAFEPDLENYRELCSAARSSAEKLGEMIMLPCGLGEHTSMLRFHSGAGAASGVGEEGMSTVQVVALDDVLPTFAPTFIKLDIEGAEPMALRGATKSIRDSQPRLAVCVYHAPDHLWTIPKLIREIEPAYHLALRYHRWNGFDTVAYAYLPS